MLPSISCRRFIPALAGNTSTNLACRSINPGSSPLSRGIPAPRTHVPGTCRFIPALAGNTFSCRALIRKPAVHPRSRGEYLVAAAAAGLTWGSSPLSRGIHDHGALQQTEGRFIPALAGNTVWAECVAWLTKVHPRSRGEYGVFHPTAPDAEGSSPLSRGIQTGMTLSFHLPRFIPALAGNTLYPQLVFHPWRVHPRSRGEYFHVEVTGLLGAGSSPLSRGILRTGAWIRVGLRFIPALAGNTPHLGGSGRGWPVHPRSRGEYFDAAFLDRGWLGSSPLSRGIRSQGCLHESRARFIPALAGNTVGYRTSRSASAVHPRSRGEYPHGCTV